MGLLYSVEPGQLKTPKTPVPGEPECGKASKYD